jgi:hypothetical protein
MTSAAVPALVSHRLEKLICLARAAPVASARNAVEYRGHLFSHRDLLCGLRVAAGAADCFGGGARPGEDYDHPHRHRAYIVPSTVQISVNGTHLTDLTPGQSYTGGVPRGAVTLTLTQAGDIGHYNLEFNAVPGKTYAFEVSPRIEPRVAIALGGFAGVLLEEAASGEHSGGFKITPVQ